MRNDLEFYTSEELIRELLARTTFVGIVIHSEKEAIGVSKHKSFQMSCSSNLNPDQAFMILDSCVEYMKETPN